MLAWCKISVGMAAAVALTFAGSASGTPLTFYTDEASWLSAASGHAVGPYASNVTETDVYTTIGGGGYPACGGFLCILSTSYSTPYAVGFTNFIVNLDGSGGAYDGDCTSDYADCTATGITGQILQFSHPIFGFASSMCYVDLENSGEITINGQGLPIAPYDCPFFGVIGPISSLDFESDPLSDAPAELLLDNIVVASTPEPATLAIVGTGVIFLSFRARLKRKRA